MIVLDGTSGITSPNETVTGSLNTPNTFAYKNLLIDAGFTINQRAYVSAATLASGAYGHDRWKAALSTPEYKIWWQYSTVVERNNYLVNDVLKILGKSDEEIDQMFIGASQL